MVVQVVDGRVDTQGVGHPDNDGAVRGERTESFDGRGSAGVVADLFQVADDQDGPVGEQRQRDPQQEQVEVRQFDDVRARRRGRKLTEYFGQFVASGVGRDPREPRCQPAHLLGENGLHRHGLFELIDIGESSDGTVSADRPRIAVTHHGDRAVAGLESPGQRQ
jgi:hypothetical protein